MLLMVVRSDAACPRCGGPALHAGACTDSNGEVYPVYAALAETWSERGRPPLSADEVLEMQEAARFAASEDEGPL
jgi:hypothetical protein